MYHINKEITGNGENLTLKHTAKHYFKDFKILGNSKQETREGYNKLKNTATTQRINGVTFTVNKDGTVIVNGTATAVAYIEVNKFSFVANQEYILSGCPSGGSDDTYKMYCMNTSTNGSITNDYGKGGKIKVGTEQLGVIRIRIANGYTANNLVFKPMIVEGTEEKPYEQYGASPSIEYEAPIESVGDNINLFDISQVTPASNCTINNEVITSRGLTGNHQYVRFKMNEMLLKANQIYYFTFKIKLNSGTYSGGVGLQAFNIQTIIGSGKAISTPNITSEYQECKYSIIPNEDTILNLLLIQLEKNATDVIISIKDIKISKGEIGAYSPYGQGSIEIKQFAENLSNFLYSSDNKTEGTNYVGVTYKIINEYSSIISGKPTNTEYRVGNQYNSTDVVAELKEGKTYIFENNLKLTMQATIVDSNAKSYRQVTIQNGEVLTLNKGETGVSSLRFGVDINTTYNNTLLEYYIYDIEQYKTKALYTQQPFRAIGDVKDRFVKQNGVWYEKHNIAELILNGNETWTWHNDNFAFTTLKGLANTPITETLVMSNYLLGVEHGENGNVWKNNNGIIFSWNSANILCIKDTNNFSDVETLKTKLAELYNAGTPLYVDYLLAEPLLIPCTPEQVEQLEEIEKEMYSYDEVTNIYSTDKISPYFDVIAYQKISEEFKTRLKEGKITRGYLKVLATDTLPEIIIDENNYLKDLKIEELRYVPEEGFIGGAVAKRVSGNFNNVDNSFDIQDREVEVYLGVELEDETTEYIKYGTYIVQRPEDDQVTDNTSFEALDYMVKFNQEYKDRITYPCKLKELLNDVLDQAGVSSKTNTFANSDFIVENNQFEQGTTLRDIIKAIAQMAFNWARIDEDDNFVMDFEINEEVDEELSTDDYFGFKKTDEYGPVNVIVLRNSQIEGENVTIKDEKLISSPKGYNLLPIETINTTINNVTVVNNGDGSITLNGTASAYTPITIFANKEIKIKPDMYTVKKKEISGTYTTTSQFLELQDENSQRVLMFGEIQGTTGIKQEKTAVKGYIAFAGGTVFENYTFVLSLTNSANAEKPYQPYIPVGEVELVIADNPFAYTELKRKQLIEAGRRLFGLRYTPMAVDMLGLMYLNAKDRIAVENLNGEKFNTYLLDHTIDYTGIVLDSMESKAKTQTETKYQYVSPLSQGISHVEIKVDKANKRIDAIVKDQEDVSEKVANTVARIEVVYALSDSPTEAPTTGWETTAPPWVEGKYMWQKTITTYANGTSVETAATNISGAQGKDGISGNNSYSYVAFANSADGSKDFSRTDSTNKTYIGTLTINESVNENLLRNTNKGTTNWGFQTQNGVVSKEQYTEEGKNAVKLTCTTASTGWQYASYSIGTDTLKRLKENSNYILSFDIKTNIGPSTLEVAIKKGDSTNAISQGVKADILGDETWEHFSVQLKTISDFSNITIGGQVVYFIGMNKVGYYIIENLKLEEGYRETSYSKSPEDLANDYTQYYWQYTKGEEGVGVSEVVDEYYLSTSDTEQTGGEWKETQDAFEEGKYIWTRSKITWTNGNITYTTPILANTLNNINSNIVVLQTFQSKQTATNQAITDSVSSVTTRLNNDYLTEEQVNSKIDGLDKEYEILEERVAKTELTAEGFKVQIDTINNQGVDKITTSLGYTFNDTGLNINRDNADTGTIVNETGIQVLDKTGAEETPLLYAGYVKEGNTDFPDYEGQTIVATSNLIVKNFLVIGSNSRFQDYENLTLGGQGTGAFEI